MMDREMPLQQADPGSVADVEEQAEVWPGDVDTTGLLEAELPGDSLTKKQRRRADALHEARIIMERRGGGFATGSQTPPQMFDLLTVANFILTGEYVWYDMEGVH